MNDFNFRLNTSAGRLPLLPDCGHPQPCGHALSSDKCRKSENKLLIVTDFSMLHLQENKLTTWLSLQIFTNNKEVCGRTFPVNSILWLAVCWVRLNIGYYQMSSYIKKTNTRIIQDIKFPTTSKEMHFNSNEYYLCDICTKELHTAKTSHYHRHCHSLACCPPSLAKTDVLGENFFIL